MAKYHVRADGQIGTCRAKEENCPFSGEEGTKHFTNVTDAMSYSEEIARKNEKSNKSLNKSNGGLPPIPPSTHDGGHMHGNGDDGRTARLTENPYPGLDATYDPGVYDREDAERLYNADVEIMKHAEAHAGNFDLTYAQDSKGRGMVVPVPERSKQSLSNFVNHVDLALHDIEMDSKHGDGAHEYGNEFCTYFANPDSYVMLDDHSGKVDLSGMIRRVDPDSEEALRVFDTENYIDMGEAFSEYAEWKGLDDDEEEELYDYYGSDDSLIMNKTQLDATRWAMNRYRDSSGALVRREDEILVFR